MASNGHGARDALVEALAGKFAHHARQARIDVAEQIRAAFRAAGFTGPYLDAGHLVGTLPPTVGGLPPPAELVDDAAVVLVDDDGVVLAVEDAVAAADHTHPAGGGPPTGAAGGDLGGSYPNPQIAAGVIVDADVAAANKDGLAAVPSLRTLGAGAQQAAGGTHAHAGVIVNPMTTAEDLVKGGTAGTPTRLGKGPADGQVLTASGGVVDWLAPPATLNLLTNPGLDVWQRSAGPFTLHNSYTADGWGMQLAGTTTMSVTRVTTPVDAGSQYAAQLVVASWSANANFWQRVENFAALRGVVITYAVRVRSTVASAVRPWVSADGATAVFGSFHSGGGAFETLTVTVTVPPTSPGLSAGIDLLANGTYQVDNATLVVGSTPAAYRPLHTADELARCQRYYWEIGGLDANEFVDVGQNTSTTGGLVVLRYAVEMIAAPTITVSAPGDWQVFSAAGAGQACTGFAAGLITKRSCRFSYTVASGLVAGDAALLRANSTVAARLRFDAPVPP